MEASASAAASSDAAAAYEACYSGNADALQHVLSGLGKNEQYELVNTPDEPQSGAGHHQETQDSTDEEETGFTCLHYACLGGSLACVEALLACQANLAARTSQDRTPLHLAAWRGRPDIVRALLQREAALRQAGKKTGRQEPTCIEVRDSQGQTPWQVARMLGYIRAGKIMQELCPEAV